jgi:gamma-glutamyltranspeptidase
VIDFEAGRLSDAVIADLEARGHTLQARGVIGVANSILVTEGQFEGVADPRDMGAAAGF